MATERLDEIYERHIKPLSVREKFRLLLLTLQELAESLPSEAVPQHSLPELEGPGAEVWEGVEPQRFVDELRKEWDLRP